MCKEERQLRYDAHNLTQAPETAKGFTSRYWDVPTSPLYPFGHGLSPGTDDRNHARGSRKPGAERRSNEMACPLSRRKQ
jgi:hypothetical protein